MAATLRFIVSGRVQGVGFRVATRTQALALGLRGRAINRHDGRVEVLVQGPAEALAALERWLGQGPDGSRVEQVLREIAPEQDLPGFTTG